MAIINNSLRKELFYMGERKNFCPYKVFTHSINKTHKITTESQLKGSYFETQCIGSGAQGVITNDLPRNVRNGNKKADHERIDIQTMNFERICREKEIIISDLNTQLKIYKRWEHNDDVILSGELDILSFMLNTVNEKMFSIIDLKLTGDLDNDFGEYSWANPAAMDHGQAIQYLYLMENIDVELNMEHGNTKIIELVKNLNLLNSKIVPEFHYWVFEYGKNLRNKFIKVDNTSERRRELHENIDRTYRLLNEFDIDERWDEREPAPYNCRNCAHFDCPKRQEKKVIDNEHSNYEII